MITPTLTHFDNASMDTPTNWKLKQRKKEMDRRERKLDKREQRLQQREKKVLNQFASALREAGYEVRRPGNWLPCTPAKELVTDTRLARALSGAYDSAQRDEQLTDRSYTDGELTIEDLSEDFTVLRKAMKTQWQIGDKTVRRLRQNLQLAGVLEPAD